MTGGVNGGSSVSLPPTLTSVTPLEPLLSSGAFLFSNFGLEFESSSLETFLDHSLRFWAHFGREELLLLLLLFVELVVLLLNDDSL